MYEGVHARPDGDSTVSRMALAAREYGFSGIVVRNHGDNPASYDPQKIRDEYDIDVVPAVEIRSDNPSRAGGFVGAHRDSQTIVLVHGGTPEINRFAVEQPAVDVLAHPMAGEGDFNHVLAQRAVENGVRIEYNFAPVLRWQGGRRVQAIQKLRKLHEILETYETPFVVSADPQSHLQLRSPRALQAVGEEIGFEAAEIADGLAEWGVIAERNRERQDDSFIQQGVRRVDECEK